MSKKQTNKMISKILTRAVRIMDGRGWTKGAEAVDAKGKDCDVNSPEACRFCAIGSVKRAIHDENGTYNFKLFNDIQDLLDEETSRATKFEPSKFVAEYDYSSQKGHNRIVDFNDVYAKDKRYVIRLFNRVIDNLKKVK